jgi:hypothetical protein
MVNVGLIGWLAARWFEPATAVAQAARPSDYLQIPGAVQSNPAQIIYIIDEQNAMLSARSFDGRKMVDMAPIDLSRIFNGADNGKKPKR